MRHVAPMFFAPNSLAGHSSWTESMLFESRRAGAPEQLIRNPSSYRFALRARRGGQRHWVARSPTAMVPGQASAIWRNYDAQAFNRRRCRFRRRIALGHDL